MATQTIYPVTNAVNATVTTTKATRSKKTAKKQEKIEMNPNTVDETQIDAQSDEVTTANGGKVYEGSGNKKIINPITLKEEVREGKFSLPLATSSEHALSLVKNVDDDLVFWFNHGRKMQARIQMYGELDVDWGSEKLNDDYASFVQALTNMITDKTTEERKEKIRQFILDEEKFAELRVAIEANKNRGGFAPVFVDYSTVELKKPSGIRGRKAGTPKEEAASTGQ